LVWITLLLLFFLKNKINIMLFLTVFAGLLELNLSQNKISELPDTFQKLTSLQKISVDSQCPSFCPTLSFFHSVIPHTYHHHDQKTSCKAINLTNYLNSWTS